MANPILSSNKEIYDTFANSGFQKIDTSGLAEGAKKIEDFKEEKDKSVYETLSDLDATQLSAMQGEVDAIYADIDSGKLKYSSPEFLGRVEKLKAGVAGAQEAKELNKAVQEDWNTDRTSKGQFVLDEKTGNMVYTGYDDYTKKLNEFNQSSYMDAQSYAAGLAGVSTGVEDIIDQEKATKVMMEDIDDLATNAIDNLGIDEETGVKITPLTLSRKGIQISKALGEEKINQIAENVVDRFQKPLLQMAAINRSKGLVPEGMSDKEYITQHVKERVKKGISKYEAIPTGYSQRTTNKDEVNGWTRTETGGWASPKGFTFGFVGEPLVKGTQIKGHEYLGGETDEKAKEKAIKNGYGRLAVTGSNSSEGYKTFISSLGYPDGKLAAIKKGPDGLELELSTGKDGYEMATVPWEGNDDKMMQFYGITKQQALDAIQKGVEEQYGMSSDTDTDADELRQKYGY